jgi:hypothetical protein
MYNTDMPTRAQLPSSAQLLRSTLIASGVAAALLVTVVLPSEYGIDPTGAGRALGLTEMGEIKTQLAQEAEADRAKDQAGQTPTAPMAPATPAPEQRSSLLGAIFAQLVIGSAQAQTPAAAKSENISVTLQPGEGTEVKADMKQGAKLTYSWKVEGGTVNHDTHGAGDGSEHSYSKGRGVPGDAGVLTAAFDGNHGWFWRNRGSAPVTVKLTASGEFGTLKRVK